MITKETARKKFPPGRKRQRVWSRQRGERAWGEEREWEDRETQRERQREERIE